MPAKMSAPRFYFVLAIVVTIAWVSFLISQVINTANPVVFSRPHILSSPIIVEGTVQSSNSLKVTKVWWGDNGLLGQTLAFSPSIPFSIGVEVIAPLRPTSDGKFELAKVPTGIVAETVPGAEVEAKVYLANPKSRGQLESLLDWRREQDSAAKGEKVDE